jgi:hypothetical protein
LPEVRAQYLRVRRLSQNLNAEGTGLSQLGRSRVTGDQKSRNPESASQPRYRFDARYPAGLMIIADDQVRRSATLSEFAKRGAVGSGRQHLITPIAKQPSHRFQDQRIIVNDGDKLGVRGCRKRFHSRMISRAAILVIFRRYVNQLKVS